MKKILNVLSEDDRERLGTRVRQHKFTVIAKKTGFRYDTLVKRLSGVLPLTTAHMEAISRACDELEQK